MSWRVWPQADWEIPKHSGRQELRVLIVGAGVAGMSLARALELKGLVPEVVERRSEWSASATGLYLPGNASRAFSRLGLRPDLSKIAMPIRHQKVLGPDGKELHTISTEAFWHACGPCLALSRSDLHSVLLNSLSKTSIRMGRSIDDIRQERDGCDVTFEDGRTERYDLVVGADGIRSQVRQCAFPNVNPIYTGNVCWRFLADNTVGVDCWTAMIGRGQTLLAIPVSPSTVYVYADRTIDLSLVDQYSETTDLERLFANFSGSMVSLVKNLSPRTRVHFSKVEAVPSGRWHNGRIVLIGDAAHASLPSMAEGAGLAAEDALLLSEAVSDRVDIDQALHNFARQRQPRVAWVHKQCAIRDRMRMLPAFLSGPLLKHFGASIYERNYRPLLAPI